MRTHVLVVGIVVGLGWCAQVATAQSALAESSSQGQQFHVTPYLWGSAFVGQVGIGGRTADVDASFSNILDHLHFAAMGVADARWNRVVVITDALYTDLRGQSATPGPLFSSVNPQQKMFILTPEAGYRIIASDSTSLDVLGGIRYWRLDSQLTFQPGILPGVDLQATRNWVDGLAGAKFTQSLHPRLWLTAYGDLGAGGSTHTYQLLGVITFDLREHVSLMGGYRDLNVKYDNNVMLDTSMRGPLFGLTFRF